jgi:deoxyribose-phosphate aldolase
MEVFDKYTHTAELITEKISSVLTLERPKVDRKEALKFILSSIDLTTLNGNDTEATVNSLCEKALSFENKSKGIPSVAAICVYPPFVQQAKRLLSGSGIDVASVAGCFPSGQSPLFVKLSEVVYVVAKGADEIDMVISRGKFLEGKYEEVGGEIAAIKKIGGKTLKVILETSELNSIENIRKASEIAILAGGDFIKTSTGKITPAATLEAAWVMMETISEYEQKTGVQIGFKPAGGISEPDDAIDYYILLRHLLGEKWMNKNLFRIGASRLADKIYNELTCNNINISCDDGKTY